jgi:hypothetical protein
MRRSFILAGVIAGATCGCAGKQYPVVEPNWPGEFLRVNFQRYVQARRDRTRVLLSADNKSLCVWWVPWTREGAMNASKGPLGFLVFDAGGKLVADSADPNLTPCEALRDFPSFAWRWRFRDFLKNASAWGFSADSTEGVRLFKDGPSQFHAEMWRLSPQQNMAWARALPTGVVDTDAPVHILSRPDLRAVLVPISGREGVLLSRDDGTLIDQFRFGTIESFGTRNRFRLPLLGGGPSVRFSSGDTSVDPSGRLIACGCVDDRRVRVVSIDPPHKMVFEANTNDHAERPRGGVWSVTRVEFVSQGKYLLVEYHFGGRGTRVTYNPSDIFDTATWRKVWHENSLEVRSVTLSPDGKKMAFIRGDYVEVGPFQPNVASAKAK